MSSQTVTYVEKACAYITREDGALLVFRSAEDDRLQVPKGTIEAGESPSNAVLREIEEESGLAAVGDTTHLATDVWNRRDSPPKRYVRHFFHTTVHEPRERWTHVVTGEGAERGMAFEYSWLDLPAAAEFALELDDYLHLLDA
ncbi:NUDIX hydrolase [Halomarina rubra]|uniref:NUDIX domain-containing protein n=1 Tax=Halomarina rubra TaxID=2071873 RepID=A0ABD6AU01_9EURY|nr:NUDIX domain-containing protein [Halomarina rubra]